MSRTTAIRLIVAAAVSAAALSFMPASAGVCDDGITLLSGRTTALGAAFPPTAATGCAAGQDTGYITPGSTIFVIRYHGEPPTSGSLEYAALTGGRVNLGSPSTCSTVGSRTVCDWDDVFFDGAWGYESKPISVPTSTAAAAVVTNSLNNNAIATVCAPTCVSATFRPVGK